MSYEDIAMLGFLQLPGGLPWWVALAILLPTALYGLMVLAMPFLVFGIKSRLERIEARLEEVQEEIRGLAFRLPEPSAHTPPLPPATKLVVPATSNVATASDQATRDIQNSIQARKAGGDRQPRFEPRIDWPR
jgi:hypothetical protein